MIEMRYITAHNFIGRPIKGYRDPLCIVTRETAEALGRVQAAVRARGFTLKVYDCYRPQRAVDDFVAWGKAAARPAHEGRVLPARRQAAGVQGRLHRREVRPQPRQHRRPHARHAGHRARRSATTGATGYAIAAARVQRRFRDNTIDMGTGYDCFDPLSHPFNARITGKRRANRMKLRRAMLAQGFKGLETEWWHFTLRNEPYPETFFDFPVSRAALAG